MTGMLASSKAGHDKDKIYVIIKDTAEYVWLADGERKTLENPKKKNRKHIQVIRCFSGEELTKKLKKGENVTNLELKMFLKEYKRQAYMADSRKQ